MCGQCLPILLPFGYHVVSPTKRSMLLISNFWNCFKALTFKWSNNDFHLRQREVHHHHRRTSASKWRINECASRYCLIQCLAKVTLDGNESVLQHVASHNQSMHQAVDHERDFCLKETNARRFIRANIRTYRKRRGKLDWKRDVALRETNVLMVATSVPAPRVPFDTKNNWFVI